MDNNLIANLRSLNYLLTASDVDDLDVLVDYITDAGKGRITLEDNVCKRLVECKEKGEYSEADRSLISHEIRRFGGNTLTNAYRDVRSLVPLGGLLDKILPETSNSVNYIEIVQDVASHLKAPFNKDSEIESIEDSILRKLLSDSIEKMTDEERRSFLDSIGATDKSVLRPTAVMVMQAIGKAGGFKTFKIAVIVANAVYRAIFGKGLPFVAGPILAKTISAFLGPIGWLVSGVWTVADMASPAYRVTTPCVVHIALMRQKLITKENSKTCAECSTPNDASAKFCSECGKPLTEAA